MFSQDITRTLPTFLPPSFRYSRLGQIQDRTDESPSGTTPSLWDLLSSKRLRWTLVLALAGLLVFFSLPRLRLESDRFWRPIELPSSKSDDLDWSRFAYAQYVTNRTAYLCNSLLVFEALHRLQSRPDRILMYPEDWTIDESSLDTNARLLIHMRARYQVKLIPVRLQKKESDDDGSTTWGDSFTKLLAFNQTQYDRVLSLDSDSTILKHMDELFQMPSAPIAMPRAYWLNPDDRVLSSQLVLIEPSRFELDRILQRMENRAGNEYDMDLVNHLYKDNAMVLPHRRYDILSGEFRGSDHTRYLGNNIEPWDADKIINETKFVHFSDWPFPKPWICPPPGLTEKKRPSCETNAAGQVESCRNQEIWLWLYSDFAERRKNLCGLDLDPAPDDQIWDRRRRR